MKVLEKSLSFLNFIGLCCTRRLREPTNEFMRCTVVSYLLMASIITLSIGSAFYIHRNFRDFSKSTNSLIVFMGGIEGIIMFISVGLNMTKIKRLYGDIQTVVKKGNIRLIIINFE